MKMIHIILLFAISLKISIQIVQARFFCDNYLREIYLVNETTQSQTIIKTETIEKEDIYLPYSYDDLAADPGALIKFKCYNSGGPSFGAGCFLINNKCRCYMFNIDGKEINYGDSFTYNVKFNNIECSDRVYWIYTNDLGDYYYYHYIPLDVDEIICTNKVITVPKNTNYIIKFSDFIETSFNVTNLKISVIENYKYFTLNNNSLSKDKKFNVSNELIFFHNESTKINIKFKNYGVVLGKDKICELNLRVCYDKCTECHDIDLCESIHKCLKCKDGAFFIENTNDCVTKEQMKESNYYFDNDKKIFRKCYNECKTCFNEGDKNDMKCLTCDLDKFFAEPNNCINKISNYYYSEEEKKYKKCYANCNECYENSSEINHNCKNCREGYHFIYNDEGKCVSPLEIDDSLFLDINNNTYKLCPQKIWINKCIKKQKYYFNLIIITLNLLVIVVAIVVFYVFKKNLNKLINRNKFYWFPKLIK